MKFDKAIDYDGLMALRKDAEALGEMKAVEKARTLAEKYKVRESTLFDYLNILRLPSDILVGLRDGKIHSRGIRIIAQMKLDEGTRDWLARQAIQGNITMPVILKFRDLYYKYNGKVTSKNKEQKTKVSVAELLAIAQGKLRGRVKTSHKGIKTFAELVKELNELGFDYRSLLRMLFEHMPKSPLMNGDLRQEVIREAYRMRHSIRETLQEVDAVVEEFFTLAQAHASSEFSQEEAAKRVTVGVEESPAAES